MKWRKLKGEGGGGKGGEARKREEERRLAAVTGEERENGRREREGKKGRTYGSEGVNNGDNSRLGGEALTLLSGDEGRELVDVDDRAPEGRLVEVEVAHTNLTEVTGVVLVKVGAVVVLTTSLFDVGKRKEGWGANGQHSALRLWKEVHLEFPTSSSAPVCRTSSQPSW